MLKCHIPFKNIEDVKAILAKKNSSEFVKFSLQTLKVKEIIVIS